MSTEKSNGKTQTQNPVVSSVWLAVAVIVEKTVRKTKNSNRAYWTVDLRKIALLKKGNQLGDAAMPRRQMKNGTPQKE